MGAFQMGMLSDKVVLSKWRKEKGWREERRKEREDMEIKEKHWHVFYKQTTVKKGNLKKRGRGPLTEQL